MTHPLREQSENVINLFRSGDYEAGNMAVAQWIDTFQKTIPELSQTEQDESWLKNFLAAFLDAQEREDYMFIADLLEGEFLKKIVWETEE
ncbi:MAG: hypothetical protein ACLFQK_11395 [Fibrobacterota bacterium]